MGDRFYFNTDLSFMDFYDISAEFIKEGIEDSNIIKLATINTKNRVSTLLRYLKKGDRLIVYDYKSLNVTIAEFNNLYESLKENGNDLKFLTESKDFLNVILSIMETERSVLSGRIKEARQNFKDESNSWGRPSISEEKKERIRYLHHVKKKSVRQIAEECDVALGTVSKYIKDSK